MPSPSQPDTDPAAPSPAEEGPQVQAPPKASARGKQIDVFLKLLLDYGGSDLHIAVGEPPRLRIDGKLRKLDYPNLNRQQVDALLRQIMQEGHRREFDENWEVDFAYHSDRLGRFRVNAFQQRKGSSAVFRAVPTDIPSPDDINMPHALREMATRNKGLVLVTGPTGSGKSTTLASLVNLINNYRPAHIVTIEDPIEFIHTSKRALISQREVGSHTKSFSAALRSALREDPDVILVGELRDTETMNLAVTAAETGHLVLGTLHTLSAAKTIDRIVDAFPGEQQAQIRTQLSEALAAVVAQQLLPLKSGGGRTAAFEVMLNNRAIANLIREQKVEQVPSTMQTSKQEGMIMMDDSLMTLVEQGLIEAREALSRASDRKAMKRNLRKAGYIS